MATRVSRVVARLVSAGHKVSIAETSAGGLVAAELLAQPGASKFFAGGVVAYTRGSKQQFLGLDPSATKPTATAPHALEVCVGRSFRIIP